MPSDSKTTDMPARLRAMAAEWDDPMCSENPVHPLLLDAADELERLRALVIHYADQAGVPAEEVRSVQNV